MWKLMVLLYGVLDLLTETANGQVNLERHFSRCKVDNAGFDDCVKEGLNELTPYFESGLPEYGVDPFDPFYAQEVYQKMSGPFFSYKLILRNVSESGWTQSQVTGLRSDFPKDMIQITQFFPDKRLKGIYEIDGTFFGQKVKNSGSWNLALFDYIQTLSISRKPQRDLTGKEMARPPIKPRSSKNRPFLTHSTPPGTRLSSDNSLGSLRLQVQYTEDRVFPAAIYDNLKSLLLQSSPAQPVTNSSVYVLGEIIINKIEIAPPLVRILLHSEKVVPIIRSLATVEISKVTDPTTIFRGNTLVSKMMDEAMRLIGLQYLHKTLRPTLELIFSEKKPCEIDPTRVRDPNTIQTNQANLKAYIQNIFDDITQSAVHCPALMCQIFHNLKECAMLYFPNNKEVRYSVISGFIFLRFFAPAILGPRLFDLTTQAIDCQTNRTLTLISKTIQSLGNLVSCRSTQQVCKEEYMDCLYKEFCTDIHKTAMKKFLEIISANTSSPQAIENDKPVTLKEGLMIKRAQGRKRFGRKNFKQRYFKLTTHNLSYSKSRGKDALCEIPLSNILAVERLAETSFKMKNMFQIVQPERALYVQAANCVEEKEWVDLLTKICQTNANRLKKYHPSAFINGEWMCCKSPNELAPGCSEVSQVDSNNYHMTLDPERDLQRIHSLIIGHIPHLEKYIQVLEEREPMICDVLKKLHEVAFEIEYQHRIYKRALDRNTKYGSLATPIGDDNYLLASRMNLDPTVVLRGMTTTESTLS
ncbi:hypothetical protein HUJ05_003871 [Dendroctonus ponderosae]|nr:hypothetical protein HUJ05_003871 [Dendroctonus ponderosae]